MARGPVGACDPRALRACVRARVLEARARQQAARSEARLSSLYCTPRPATGLLRRRTYTRICRCPASHPARPARLPLLFSLAASRCPAGPERARVSKLLSTGPVAAVVPCCAVYPLLGLLVHMLSYLRMCRELPHGLSVLVQALSSLAVACRLAGPDRARVGSCPVRSPIATVTPRATICRWDPQQVLVLSCPAMCGEPVLRAPEARCAVSYASFARPNFKYFKYR